MIPLPSTHPELTVTTNALYTVFKVDNWHLKPDGSGRVVRGVTVWLWPETLVPVLLAYLCNRYQNSQCLFIGTLIVLILAYKKCTQVLSESILVIPRHGLQFETERGLPGFTLFTTRRFIPTCMLRDVLINEGLSGWNVRYYLTAVCESGQDGFFLKVAFENILPRFPVLFEVYNGIQELLFEQANTNTTPPELDA